MFKVTVVEEQKIYGGGHLFPHKTYYLFILLYFPANSVEGDAAGSNRRTLVRLHGPRYDYHNLAFSCGSSDFL